MFFSCLIFFVFFPFSLEIITEPNNRFDHVDSIEDSDEQFEWNNDNDWDVVDRKDRVRFDNGRQYRTKQRSIKGARRRMKTPPPEVSEEPFFERKLAPDSGNDNEDDDDDGADEDGSVIMGHITDEPQQLTNWAVTGSVGGVNKPNRSMVVNGGDDAAAAGVGVGVGVVLQTNNATVQPVIINVRNGTVGGGSQNGANRLSQRRRIQKRILPEEPSVVSIGSQEGANSHVITNITNVNNVNETGIVNLKTNNASVIDSSESQANNVSNVISTRLNSTNEITNDQTKNGNQSLADAVVPKPSVTVRTDVINKQDNDIDGDDTGVDNGRNVNHYDANSEFSDKESSKSKVSNGKYQ